MVTQHLIRLRPANGNRVRATSNVIMVTQHLTSFRPYGYQAQVAPRIVMVAQHLTRLRLNSSTYYNDDYLMLSNGCSTPYKFETLYSRIYVHLGINGCSTPYKFETGRERPTT